MRVAVLYSQDDGLRNGAAVDAIAVRAGAEAAEAVLKACRENGWQADRIDVGIDLVPLLAAVREATVVVNLAESVGGDPGLEPAVAWLLEWSGLPFTGASGAALAVALDKPVANAVLTAAGVAVPRGCVLSTGEEPLPALRYPAIVKPARHDASHGIDDRSVVADADAARERARRVITRYAQPALVEEFIDGREFAVGLLAGDVLPIREVAFRHPHRVVTYEAKWAPDSAAFAATPVRPADALETGLSERVASTARRAWAALGLRGYARVDIRLDRSGDPVVLDVNPNPDLSPDAGLAAAAAHAGIDYVRLVRLIVEDALHHRAPAPAPR
jgi:D-alanine-D-alanine ligase